MFNLFLFISSLIEYAHLIIWDDIGCSELKQYDYTILLGLLSARSLAERSNIFTGNLSPAQAATLLGGKLYDRICVPSVQIELKGLSQRYGLKWEPSEESNK